MISQQSIQLSIDASFVLPLYFAQDHLSAMILSHFIYLFEYSYFLKPPKAVN